MVQLKSWNCLASYYQVYLRPTQCDIILIYYNWLCIVLTVYLSVINFTSRRYNGEVVEQNYNGWATPMLKVSRSQDEKIVTRFGISPIYNTQAMPNPCGSPLVIMVFALRVIFTKRSMGVMPRSWERRGRGWAVMLLVFEPMGTHSVLLLITGPCYYFLTCNLGFDVLILSSLFDVWKKN